MDEPGEQPHRSEKLVVLCCATFLVMAGQGVVGPVLPIYAANFGASATVVGLTLTIFAFARLILNIPAGLLADRFGRKMLLVGGPAITAIGMFGSGWADSILSLLAWRFVAGAGSAFYMSGALIYLIDIAPPDKRARYIAINQWALSVGIALGPGIGGIVAERYGLASPFYLVGAMSILASVYAIWRLPETRKTLPPKDLTRISLKDGEIQKIVFSRQFIAIALVTSTIFMTRAGTRATLVPLYANNSFGWGPGEIGIVFTITGMMTLLTLWPATWAVENIGKRQVILFSGLAAGLGAFLIAIGSSPTWFVVGNIIMTLGTGTAGPAPAAYIAELFPEHLRGLGIGIYRSAGDLGFVLAPPGLGLISEMASMSVALYVASFLVILAGVWFVIVDRTSTLKDS